MPKSQATKETPAEVAGDLVARIAEQTPLALDGDPNPVCVEGLRVMARELIEQLDRLVELTPPGLPQLQLDPNVESLHGLDGALRCLSWIDHRRAQIEAVTKLAVDRTKERIGRRLFVEVDGAGEPVGFQTLRETYERAILDYVEQHPQEFVDGARKSRKLGHGEAGFRQQPVGVGFKAGETAAKVLKKVIAEHGLIAKVIAWLKRLKIDGIVRVTLALDMAELRKAAQAGTLDSGRLPEGMKVIGGKDAAFCKPSDYTAQEAA